jgi:hypothetical protein
MAKILRRMEQSVGMTAIHLEEKEGKKVFTVQIDSSKKSTGMGSLGIIL